ncbi:MAG TPA: GNAT family N-acetyltransferase [Anaerolineae bacterium]|nr:GNAT family N-acetyltransferase [Anaerolineae bacterium]
MPTPKLMVKRARPVDAAAIAEFVSAATQGRLHATEDDVLDRMGTRGFFVANAKSLVGLAGWTAENLVARIEDFLVHPIDLRPTAGRELLNAVEDAARELECEAALLLVARHVSMAAMTFFESCGYSYKELAELPEAWREAAQVVLADDHFVMVKQLRSELVRQPI